MKRIHRTCLYEEFEENTEDMFIWRIWREYIGYVIWRVWREYIGHVYMQSLKRIHRTCLYEEFEENT
jgi:hypothetical protein